MLHSRLYWLSASFASLLSVNPALANDGNQAAAFDVSGAIMAVSDYRFRGVSSSDGKPAIQAYAEVVHTSGVYGGIWSSSRSSASDYGPVEVDVYAGWSGALNPSISAKVELTYYLYPHEKTIPGFTTDSFETSLAFSATGGVIKPTIGVSYAWAQRSLGGRSNTYVFAEAEAPIPRTPFTTKAHLGYTHGSYSISADGSNLDWAFGVNFEVASGIVLGVEYVGIDKPKIERLSNDSVIFRIEKTF
jgi:uncharacterized protein (TIGR02001 family)